MWPHRWQPTRLPRPCDSPGKNTGVGCHFLLQCMKVKSEREVAQSWPTLRDTMDCSLPDSSIHGIFPGKSTGVGCHCLLHLYHWVTYKPAKGNFWGRVRFWAVSQQQATFLGTGECVLNRKWKNLRNTAQQLLQYIKLKQCFRKKYLLLPWMVYSDIF